MVVDIGVYDYSSRQTTSSCPSDDDGKLRILLSVTIACPDNKIYVFVNQSTADRTPYIFVEIDADSLQDCIHKCFGSQFCYSVKYDSTAADTCSLYYFASFNCTAQELLLASDVKYSGGAVVIDCLKCPSNGDFVTAPPFIALNDQTIPTNNYNGHPLGSKPLMTENNDNNHSTSDSSFSERPSTPTTSVEAAESQEISNAENLGLCIEICTMNSKRVSRSIPRPEGSESSILQGGSPPSSEPTEEWRDTLEHKGTSEEPAKFVTVPTTQEPWDQLKPSFSTRYPACFINFQLDTESDTSSFKHYEVEKVRR
ncbi:hypothetical protein KIN20_018440 [Parelaphostrongylus tenuis]|uniref:Apple domain-containing protein n=1 Tax=Parelaphostrongylus tenuis TaxID=148309 RepID=A0AAD5MJH1_PARTN|nr:hypothetical protein KIN20_018440 [Parelaphostrongylus tenuis]